MNHWIILESEKNLVDENETAVKIDFDFHLLVEFISKFNVDFYVICRKTFFSFVLFHTLIFILTFFREKMMQI
jgi:hypothetical protein